MSTDNTSEVLKRHAKHEDRQTIHAAGLIDKKKKQILTDIDGNKILSFTSLLAKHKIKSTTFRKALVRWGLCFEDIKSKMTRKRRALVEQEIFSQADVILHKLTKENPETFISVCNSIPTTPTRLKKIFLARDIDLQLLIRKPNGKPKAVSVASIKTGAKTLLSRKWIQS